MRYIKEVENGFIVIETLDEVKKHLKNVGLPKNPSEEVLNSHGIHVLKEVFPDRKPMKKYQAKPPKKINGKYVQEWEESDLDEHEILRETEGKWEEVRRFRNELLRQTDWMMISDVPFSSTQKSEIKKYRKELRDITKQSDPFNITWPIKPNIND